MPSDRVTHLIKQAGGRRFTIKEIAEAVGYTEFTVRRHVSEGILPSVKVAGRVFVLEEDAVIYLRGTRPDRNI